MSVPENLLYTKDHEWISLEGDVATVGITQYAADALGDVVFVAPPAVGDTVSMGAIVGEVESTKSVGEIFAPVAGEVMEANDSVVDAPDTVNSDPYGRMAHESSLHHRTRGHGCSGLPGIDRRLGP